MVALFQNVFYAEEVKPVGVYRTLKENLGYVCRHKCGSVLDLEKGIGADAVREFESVGFISSSGSEWVKSDFADRYYRDLFGWWSYAKILLVSWLSRRFSLPLQKHLLMKKLIPLIAVCVLLGCRETEIEKADGRNVQEEQKDSVSATPTFEANDWEENIEIGFDS